MSNMCWKKHLTEFIIIPWIRAALYTVFNIYLQKSLHEYSIKSDGLRIFDILTADIVYTGGGNGSIYVWVGLNLSKTINIGFEVQKS